MQLRHWQQQSDLLALTVRAGNATFYATGIGRRGSLKIHSTEDQFWLLAVAPAAAKPRRPMIANFQIWRNRDLAESVFHAIACKGSVLTLHVRSEYPPISWRRENQSPCAVLSDGASQWMRR